MDYAALPGGDLVGQGLSDLERGVESVPSTWIGRLVSFENALECAS